MATREIPRARARGLDGGGVARVCPTCGLVVEEEAVEIIAAWAVPPAGGARPPEPIPSYTTEIEDANYRRHWRREHA
jgi:hypothetical protein